MTNNRNQERTGFTLVEIMIVVAIVALLAAIAVPGFMRARKRAQATQVINDLRMIASAVDQYAVEYSKMAGNAGRYSRLDGLYEKGHPSLFHCQ